ncbi:aspartic proteinase CDR1-like [Vicia villosa]|uniref:aspartic proteinase CDR1-like n=1 Tax=Vicia villosa TaxID=3911 RepID=UPI00273AE2B4|nr:aspartic proteinase CDR1-like [Vicia villosa]
MLRFSLIILILLFLSCFNSISHSNGFSVELIHRYSSKSPFFNPTETKLQRISNAVHNSINRAYHFDKAFSLTANRPISNVTSIFGEYFMSYSVGTPPIKIYGLMDTGSSLVWQQCKPCDDCSNQISPIFDPSKSSSYKNISCSSMTCKSMKDAITSCSHDQDVCQYYIAYGAYMSKGDIITETLTFDSTSGSSTVSFPKMLIGCAHTSVLPYNDTISGLVGLGNGPSSFIRQLGPLIDEKFSYCLTSFLNEPWQFNTSSKLNFGDDAVVSGEKVVSTPLVKLEGLANDSYIVTLEAFSVGNKRIEYEGSNSTKNIILDTGTTYTLLPKHFHTNLESAVAEMIKQERVDDPNKLFTLCYNTTLNQLNFPEIIVHFSGANIKLNSHNTFAPIDNGIMCFPFLPFEDLVIFGNFAQHNLLVGYDLKKGIVSFKPTDCSKQ